jgi:DNA-binding transcriptional ArsR family regulator
MKSTIETFKLLTDELRIRILMLLNRKELSVCQLMGITGASQPLVSRNLALLYRGGFLDERRDGKLRYYRISEELTEGRKAAMELLYAQLKSTSEYREDLETLKECSEFQKKAGRCDMKTLQEFMAWKKKRRKRNV